MVDHSVLIVLTVHQDLLKGCFLELPLTGKSPVKQIKKRAFDHSVECIYDDCSHDERY